jgi:LAO/AO transport system kinase
VKAEPILEGLRAGKAAALARAISMVENGAPGFEELLGALHAQLGRSRRIGVTGPPGAGKSTLVERLTSRYRQANLTVGVIAVDPSSPFTGGALLGDRIRMERSSLDPGVFIRSMATRGSMGGMATTTGEVADVMDAFGFDRILIETVGVGQSELDVAAAADTTVVVLVPESGDGIQVMKAGLMEIADVFVVNKSDRPGADKLRQELEVSLGIRAGQVYRHVRAHHGAGIKGAPAHGRAGAPAAGEWEPPVMGSVASEGKGVAEVAEALDRHFAHLESTGALALRRRRRLEIRTRQVLERALHRWLWADGQQGEVEAQLKDVAEGRSSPYQAVASLMARLNESERV